MLDLRVGQLSFFQVLLKDHAQLLNTLHRLRREFTHEFENGGLAWSAHWHLREGTLSKAQECEHYEHEAGLHENLRYRAG